MICQCRVALSPGLVIIFCSRPHTPRRYLGKGFSSDILQKLKNVVVPWVWNNWRWQVLFDSTSQHPEQPRYGTKAPRLGPPWNPLEAELLQDGDALFLGKLCCLCGSLSENRSPEETAEFSVDGPGTQQVLTCLKILPGTRQFLKKEEAFREWWIPHEGEDFCLPLCGSMDPAVRWVRRRGRTGPWEGLVQSPLQLVYAPPYAGSSPLTTSWMGSQFSGSGILGTSAVLVPGV